MTGILVTRFQMGLITAGDLELMAKGTSESEKTSAAKKVLAGIRGAAKAIRRYNFFMTS
jgi:hypothetical protein